MATRSSDCRVALVAGATRGCGRGIAVALGSAKMKVFCTGRSSEVRRKPATPPITAEPGSFPFCMATRPETIEETARLVTAAGGYGVPVVVDHTNQEEVHALVERIHAEAGRLDVLVNSVWGGDELTEWGTSFWDLDIGKAQRMIEQCLLSHIITNRLAVPLMIKSGGNLVVEMTDGAALHYRGNFMYDLLKTSVSRMAFGMAEELRPHNIASVSVTPGFLRSEAMLDNFGVTEDNWRQAAEKDCNFLFSETPAFVGRGIAALAQDGLVMQHSGKALSSWKLADLYCVTDADGSRPNWGAHARESEFGAEQAASHTRFVDAFTDAPQ
mmetsp:Transcript_4518/g.11228  ORF Transcript_4518/g.11228 Transcript_4518/m.11228 type:complete len:327 (+) Transcript_4518:316-1296(+)